MSEPTVRVGGQDEFAPRVHFLAMAGIVGFIIVHLALVAVVPRCLPPMLTGGAAREAGRAR
jgi:thiosulfate reductase cytochrome b subunit